MNFILLFFAFLLTCVHATTLNINTISLTPPVGTDFVQATATEWLPTCSFYLGIKGHPLLSMKPDVNDFRMPGTMNFVLNNTDGATHNEQAFLCNTTAKYFSLRTETDCPPADRVGSKFVLAGTDANNVFVYGEIAGSGNYFELFEYNGEAMTANIRANLPPGQLDVSLMWVMIALQDSPENSCRTDLIQTFGGQTNIVTDITTLPIGASNNPPAPVVPVPNTVPNPTPSPTPPSKPVIHSSFPIGPHPNLNMNEASSKLAVCGMIVRFVKCYKGLFEVTFPQVANCHNKTDIENCLCQNNRMVFTKEFDDFYPHVNETCTDPGLRGNFSFAFQYVCSQSKHSSSTS